MVLPELKKCSSDTASPMSVLSGGSTAAAVLLKTVRAELKGGEKKEYVVSKYSTISCCFK